MNVKAVNVITLYDECLSCKASKLPYLALIKSKIASTFHANKYRGFGGLLLKFPVIKEEENRMLTYCFSISADIC